MNVLLLLETQHTLLDRQTHNLLTMIPSGEPPRIMQDTKQFIMTLSEYLDLQELALAEALDSPQLVYEMKRENHYIRENLDDIYMIHITEPNGEFVEVISMIVRAVEVKLRQDRKLLGFLKPESYAQDSLKNSFKNVA